MHVNLAVDRYAKAGVLGRGISFFLGRALLAGARDVQDAGERLAFGPEVDLGEDGPGPEDVVRALPPFRVSGSRRGPRSLRRSRGGG